MSDPGTSPADEGDAPTDRDGNDTDVSQPRAAGRPPAPRMLSTGLVAALALVVIVPVVIVVALLRSSGPTTHTYTVPAGTGARQDQGEQVEVMPTDLHLEVGDHLVIINEDDRVQTVGLFTVRPGETLDTPFGRPGVYKGACTVSSSGQIVITVT